MIKKDIKDVKQEDLKILFMGTPDFAVPCLKALINDSYNIVGVVTKEDRPSGRKMMLTSPPVKVFAKENNLQVIQPLKLRDESFYEKIKKLNPNLIITVAYGKILPKNILDFPQYGCINVHASLLPKYRGASPIQACLKNGDEITGITYMEMDVGMDTGAIISQVKLFVDLDMNAGDLTQILSQLGAKHLPKVVLDYCNDKLIPTKQDECKATVVKPINKKDCEINWNLPALEVHNHIRSSNPWPGAFTFLSNNRLKISRSKYTNSHSQELKTLLQENHNNLSPGCIIISDNKTQFFVMCADDFLEISSLQMEGCKNVKSSECAHNFNSFDILGG